MTTLLASAYFIGLFFMLMGLVNSEDYRKAESNPWHVMVAYVFWPVMLLMVLGYVAFDRIRSGSEGLALYQHAPVGQS